MTSPTSPPDWRFPGACSTSPAGGWVHLHHNSELDGILVGPGLLACEPTPWSAPCEAVINYTVHYSW